MKLNEIACYLPYKLMTDKGELMGIGNSLGWMGIFKHKYGHTNIPIKEIKPYLRPLSDLIKPCLPDNKIPLIELFKLVTTETEVKNCKLVERTKTYGLVINYGQDKLTFIYDKETGFSFMHNLTKALHVGSTKETMEKLYEWHFDVWGLIEKDEAINLNTVEYEEKTDCKKN